MNLTNNLTAHDLDPGQLVSSLNGTVKSFAGDRGVIAWEYLTSLVCAVGALTNITILLIILRYPLLRKGAGLFIAHLLVCHLAICAVCLPLAILRIAKVTTPSIGLQDPLVCRHQHVFHATFNTLVNWSEGLLAVNRLVAIFLPLKFPLFNRRPVQCACLCVCWAVTLAYSLPPLYEDLAVYKLSSIGTCAFVAKSAFSTALLSFNAYCPLFLMAMAGVAIVYRANLPRRRFQTTEESNRVSSITPRQAKDNLVQLNSNAKRQKRTTRMLMTSFALSLFCQVPQYISLLAGYSAAHPEIVLCFWFMQLIQFTSTPVIFLKMNKDYQHKAAVFYSCIFRPTQVRPRVNLSLVLRAGRSVKDARENTD
ncbi:hypothetical protein BV898_00475 [Hypsibius exemplaris]|uniref:G-protein coupled receptors family 1 profile domain-containing protein n=1 Tax=Hypsibius exemplaris TaxID=2072580 RepID=A0A1W0XDI4_HYPEX|nr:hypothetical protein BV898_00475 [Hypsibius exemplaris]